MASDETSSVTTSSTETASFSTEAPTEIDSGDDVVLPFDVPIFPDGMRRMKRVRIQEPDLPPFPPVPNLTSLLYSATRAATTSSSENVISGTVTAAQAPAKTGNPKPTKTKDHDSSKASCTPSPTRSLSPSASEHLTLKSCDILLLIFGKLGPRARTSYVMVK